MLALTQLNYSFPGFMLQVEHDNDYIYRANFAKLDDSLPQITGVKHDLTSEIIKQLDEYQKNPDYQFNLPYKFDGSIHQLKVWQIIRQIPRGHTISYSDAAALIHSAPRAIGGACGKNPLPVFIPCHRIIAADKKLGGFNSGNIFFSLDIKKWLLRHEGIILS
jgi:methylated-DNA-[protein]-cysteine S-methyltransferase